MNISPELWMALRIIDVLPSYEKADREIMIWQHPRTNQFVVSIKGRLPEVIFEVYANEQFRLHLTDYEEKYHGRIVIPMDSNIHDVAHQIINYIEQPKSAF